LRGTIETLNVAPAVAVPALSYELDGDYVVSATISGSFTDPGSEEFHEAIVAFGSVGGGTAALEFGARAFSVTQLFDPLSLVTVLQLYPITASLLDDDGGSGSGSYTPPPPPPAVSGDLDIVYGNTVEVEESVEFTPGGIAMLNDDNDDGGPIDNIDPEVTGGDDDLVPLKLRTAQGFNPTGAKYALVYSSPDIKLWKNASKTLPVTSGAYDFDANTTTTVYAEAASLGTGAPTPFYMYWKHGSRVELLDHVQLTPGDIDLRVYQAPVIVPAQPMVPESEEEFPGAATWLNLDNDDQDGSFDVNETDPVVNGDDELAKLRVQVTPPFLSGSLVLDFLSNVQIWKDNQKTPSTSYPAAENLLTGSSGAWTTAGRYKYRDLWLEGIAASAATADIETRLQFEPPAGGPVLDRVNVTVLDINSVEWLGTNNSLNHDYNLDNQDPNWRAANLSPTGTVRVFPDALWEGTQVGPLRDEVEVNIRLNVYPPIPVNVHLRVFDVDDPSADSSMGLNPVDTEQSADDNRGQARGFIDGTATRVFVQFGTGDNVRTTRFEVSLNPGDNYRVAANADDDFLSQLENDDRAFTANDDKQRIVDPHVTALNGGVDQELRFPARYATKTLTVWRFLNTEMDTLPALGDGNTMIGMIESIVGTATALTRITVDRTLNDSSHDLDDAINPDNGQFEQGVLTVGQTAGGAPVLTISPVIGNGDHFVDVAPATAPATIAGLSFAAEDNDYFSQPETMSGTVTQIAPVAGGNHALTLAVTSASPPWNDLVGGRIKVAGGGWVQILAANPAAFTVTVGALSIPFTLHDDDVDGALPYSTTTLHARYQTPFQDAYIEPVPIVAQDSELFTWQLNVMEDQLMGLAESQFDAWRSRGFWVAYNMWLFQFDQEKDFDASGELAETGFQAGRAWTTNRRYSGVAVESVRDQFALQTSLYQSFNYTTAADLLWADFAHEIGHQFALNHANGRLMGPAEANGSDRFHPEDLARIRNDDRSPGRR